MPLPPSPQPEEQVRSPSQVRFSPVADVFLRGADSHSSDEGWGREEEKEEEGKKGEEEEDKVRLRLKGRCSASELVRRCGLTGI